MLLVTVVTHRHTSLSWWNWIICTTWGQNLGLSFHCVGKLFIEVSLFSTLFSSTLAHWKNMPLPTRLQNSKDEPIQFTAVCRWPLEAAKRQQLLFLFISNDDYRADYQIETYFHTYFLWTILCCDLK